MTINPIDTWLGDIRKTLARQEAKQQSDGQLLERFVSRQDDVALETLVQRHTPMVWGVCRRTLSRHDAEDAFQATFVVFLQKAASIRSRDLLANWLCRVAYQTARKDRQRNAKRGSRERQQGTMPEPPTEAHDNASDPELWVQMREELDRLSEKYRTAVVLCELEGRSLRDVAQQLGLKEGTVRSRLARGREMLAQRLTRRGVTVSVTSVTAVLTEQAASGTVPVALLNNTIKAATLLATGETVTAELLRPGVSPLAESVLRAITGAKWKAASVVLLLAALAMGAGAVAYHTLPDQPSNLVEPPKGQELMLLEGHTGRVLAVAISPDGKVLASAGADGLRTWALPGGEPLTTPARDAGPVNGLAFSPDGKLLALACGNGVVKLLDVATMKKTRDLKGHNGAVLTVAFHPDGGHLASGGADGTIKLWTVNGGGDPITCKNPGWMRGPVRGLTFSMEPGDLHPNLRGLPCMLAAAGGADKGRAGWLGVWNGQTGELPSGVFAMNLRGDVGVVVEGQVLSGEGDTRGLAVAVDPHGFALASGGKGKGVSLLGRIFWTRHVYAGAVRQFDDGRGEGVYAIAFSRDGRRVISAGADGVLKIWVIPEVPHAIKQITIDSLRITRTGHTGAIRCVAVSPDGALLATGGDDYTVRVWTLPAPQPLRFIPSGP